MDKFGLSQKTYQLINDCLAKFAEIDMVKIFGSRAKGDFKFNSDIDLALYGENLTEKLLLHIKSELEELSTPYKFDIVNYNTISNENFKQSIDKSALDF